MMCRVQRVAFVVLVLGCGFVGGASHAHGQALGCYDMPSRLTQYIGYGYGAGHHAPIARTEGPYPSRIPRNVWAPTACGVPYTAAYQPVGCYGEACYQNAW